MFGLSLGPFITFLSIAAILSACAQGSIQAEPQREESSARGYMFLQSPEGPLSRYLGWNWVELGPTTEALFEKTIEKLISDCMSSKGHEYRPVSVHAASMRLESNSDLYHLSPRDYASTWGYGFSTSFQGRLPTFAVQDPNEELLERMDAQEKASWTAALQGTPAQDGRSGETLGCSESAVNNFFGARIKDFRLALQGISTQVERDHRIQEGHARWSACMEIEGFQAERPQDAQALALAWFDDALEDAAVGQTEPSGAVRIHLDGERLRRLRRDERALAIAHVQCLKDEGMANTLKAVRDEYEQSFLRQDKSMFRSVRAQVHRHLESLAAE